MIGGTADRSFVEKINKASNGNALFVIESIRMLMEQKALSKKENTWELSVENLIIPAKIKDVILQRVSTLSHAQRKLLDIASVIGEKFNVELLASVLDQNSLEVLDAVTIIAQSTSILVDEGEYFRFDHARSREVLYESVSLSLKRIYHAKIAESIEKSKQQEPPVADLAYHYIQAGKEEKAVKYSLAAGLEALSRYSNKEAINHLQYVVQKISNKPENILEKSLALEGLGDALAANNNFKESREIYEQLVEFQKDAARLRVLRKAIVAAFYENNVSKVDELTKIAEKNALYDRVEAARILSHKARCRGLVGDFSYCLKVLDEAISIYEEEFCLSDVAWDLFVMGTLEIVYGQLEKGIAQTLRSIALYDELGDIHSQLEAYLYAGQSFMYCTLDEKAIEFFSKVVILDNSYKLNDCIRLVPALKLMGNILYWKCPEEAKSLGLKALSYCDSEESPGIGAVYEFLTSISVMNGEKENAEMYYQKLMQLPQSVMNRPRSIPFFESTKALYFAGNNQFEDAYKAFEKHRNLLEKYWPVPGWDVESLRMRAWIVSKQGRTEESRALLDQAQKIIEQAQSKFSQVNILCGLITLIHPIVNEPFEIRFDIVNTSKNQGSIVNVEHLIVPGLNIVNENSDLYK